MKKIVIIFTKVPEAGHVKTRLAQTSILNDIEVSTLAKAMLMDTILLSSELNVDSICVGYTPEEKKQKILEIIDSLKPEIKNNLNFIILPQTGSNFDEKFSSVVASTIKSGFDYLVILGADLPYIHPNIIESAFTLLKKDDFHNMIIGPASGGGIYLLGISNQFKPDWFVDYKLFRGGVETSQFVKFAKKQKIHLYLLPPLLDIDLEEDLISLLSFINLMSISNYEKYYHFPKYTTNFLKHLKLHITQQPENTRRRTIKKK